MECPRRWAVVFYLIYFMITNVCCQNVAYDGAAQIQSLDQKRDVSRIINPSPKPQIYNEAPFVTNIQDDRPKSFNLMPSQTSIYPQETINFSGQPANIPNMVFSSPTPTTFGTPCASQPVVPEPISYNSFSNYANVIPTVWQNEAHNYPLVNPTLYTEVVPPPVNLQMSSPEFLREMNCGSKLQEPIVISNPYEEGFPVNLHINVPAQNMPSPRITVVSAVPQSVTPVNSEPSYNFPSYAYPAPLPIAKKKRSGLRKLLPIILIALLADEGNSDCYTCNCNCDSDSPIPIPYPIPIPTNNPIINTSGSSYSSRKRGQRDYEDYDDCDNS